MAGVHIAEALREYRVYDYIYVVFVLIALADIPYFRTFTMPWTR